MRILILKYRNIGDVILITPLIRILKSYYKNCEIDIGLNRGTEDLISKNNNIRNLIIFDREKIKSMNTLFRIYHELNYILSFKKKKYDIVINLTEGDRGAFISLLSFAKIRIGERKKWLHYFSYNSNLSQQNDMHTVDFNLQPLSVLNIPIDKKYVTCSWDKDDINSLTNHFDTSMSYIHIHPVSRWLFKCIKNEIFAELIDFCEKELSKKVVITSSNNSNELSKINQILKICKSKPINLAGKLSLRETAVLNSHAELFIGVDTAIMHLSAANNIDVVAFFGPSGAQHWGPWDNDKMNSGYTKRNGIQSMGRHTVFSEERSCQPCGKDGCDGSKVSDCLQKLDLAIVKDYIKEKIINAEK